MFTIKQFLPTLYTLLFLGIAGFGLASQSPSLWAASTTAVALNAWLVHSGRFKPMPRVLANIASLGMTALAAWYVLIEARAEGIAPIITIGDFLVLLQLVKLYEQRANRDYAQLLLLSLLMMVAAAISTASLIFGVLLLLYLALSLYCCLLFHLKIETEAATGQSAADKAARAQSGPSAEPAGLLLAQALASQSLSAQSNPRMGSSIRRLTGLIAVVSLAVATVVFIFFPRQAGEGIMGRRLMNADRVLTGFSDSVSFQQVAEITKNDEVVAQVQVSENDKPWNGEALLLRGNTLDIYSGRGFAPSRDYLLDFGFVPRQRLVPKWQWSRSSSGQDDDDVASEQLSGEQPTTFTTAASARQLVQDVTLQPTATHDLFAIAGAFACKASRDLHILYHKRDALLMSDEPTEQSTPLHYTVVSDGTLPIGNNSMLGMGSQIDPQIKAYALRPEVSGTDASGRPLASLRTSGGNLLELDGRMARAIEAHLRNTFQYTLDLTDSRDILQSDQDPLATFLTTLKKGHCEYFAGAMTLMCQSLGMKARMVIGFRSDEFNSIGHFYIVRQSHAHAWVEVLTDAGWETFDPTSSTEAQTIARSGFFSSIKSFYNYLEYMWGTTIVAYGQGNQAQLEQTVNGAIDRSAENSVDTVVFVSRAYRKFKRIVQSPTLMMVCALTMIVVCSIILIEKFLLHRRARRIGLTHLPAAEKERLARQLGFYDDLLRLLERHKIVRASHLTPMEFSDRLNFLPFHVYDDIRRLTQMFYRVRYGQVELNPQRRKRLGMVITHIDQAMRSLNRRPA